MKEEIVEIMDKRTVLVTEISGKNTVMIDPGDVDVLATELEGLFESSQETIYKVKRKFNILMFTDWLYNEWNDDLADESDYLKAAETYLSKTQ